MHLNSELLFKKYGVPHFDGKVKVLEIGPSSYPSPFQKLVNDDTIQWDTIDFVDTNSIDDAAFENLTYKLQSPYEFPIADETYDIIVSGQVMEHVDKIWLWMKELKRITKKGGKIITISPVSWPYHEAPIDCWRIYPSAAIALADEVGLDVSLAIFESLEDAELRKKDARVCTIPGRSYAYNYFPGHLKKILKWNRYIRMIPRAGIYLQVPIEVAYDNISILQKRIV